MPALDRKLIAAYRHTEYRVRKSCGGHAVIRVDQPLPVVLRSLLPTPHAPWAFLTAWNPRSQPLPVATNRSRQRELLDRLHQLRPAPRIIAGLGVGPADAGGLRWREPSLFVIGIETRDVDSLMHAFEQHAVVCGNGDGPAVLRWSRSPPRQEHIL